MLHMRHRGDDGKLCPHAKVHVLHERPKVVLRCAATSGGLGAQSMAQRAHASAAAAGAVHAGLACQRQRRRILLRAALQHMLCILRIERLNG